ncbi:MAG: MFS transporter [Candidatus Heimdallarchaeota archaeon]|nr:MAG: MFS transporter [Candidatus Heimdallarchaeota archaeon]
MFLYLSVLAVAIATSHIYKKSTILLKPIMFINKILGTQELPIQAQYYMKTFLYLSMIISFLGSLSNTFYVLFSIDHIGFALTAVCTSIMLATQLLFDYPSGSLGDWIGQRWVLAIAFIFYGISFVFLISAHTMLDFALIAVINGFGNAQSSGAFATWVDNNYRVAVGDADPDRKIYGFSTSRVNSLNNFALAASFLIGGTIATLISRRIVFTIQFGLTIIIIFLILIYLRDIKTDTPVESSETGTSKISNYIKYLKGGIRFLFSSKAAFLFLIGNAIFNVTWMIWGGLVLFPLYFGYTGTDALAGLLRTSLFLAGIPLSFYIARVNKRISNERLPIFLFLSTILFFPSFIILTTFMPPTNEFNLLGITLTFFLLWTIVGTVFSIAQTLIQRIMIDLVPSDYRNSVYSLMPTIFSLIGIPVVPLAGIIIEKFGLASGIFTASIVCVIGSVLISFGVHFIYKPKIKPIERPLTDIQAIAYES